MDKKYHPIHTYRVAFHLFWYEILLSTFAFLLFLLAKDFLLLFC